MINLETATKEELIAYIEQQQRANKNIKKTTKLLEELKEIFNDYSSNSADKFLWIHFLLSIMHSSLDIPVVELLDKLQSEPEADDIKKLVILQMKELLKTDEGKLRRKKSVLSEIADIKPEIVTPL